MRIKILTLFMVFAGIPALTIAASQDHHAQTVRDRAIAPLKTDVAGVEGKEWNVITVEVTPGAVDTRHFHPGVELVYVLEGTGRLEVDGKLPIALIPGTVAALGPKQRHVLKNASQTQPLKVLFVLLLEKGQPRLDLANRIPNVDSKQQKATEQNNSTYAGSVF